MKRTYKKKSNLINKTGYTPGYATEKNPVNYIPSESITMANTPYPLYATPLDENGNAMSEGMMMQPGGEYKFPGASYVAETPMFEKGGEKRDWISAKISKLVREEGYPQKQAVAMAYEMYDNMHKNGGYQLPMYQIAGTYNFGSALPKPKFGADPNIQSPEAFSESLNKITEVNPGDYGLGKDPNYVNALSTESLTAGEDFKKRTDEMNKAAGLPQTFSPNVFGAEVEDTKEKPAQTGLEKPDIKGQEPFQFFNPYGGVDIPTANVMFGQSLENKDTLGAVASGAKIALGTARNILGGMGQARRENYVKNQYYEKQREGMTGAGREEMKKFGGYYQEGGMQPGMEEEQGMEQQGAGQEQQMMQEVAQMLQQGADPQQVIQQLVQMGVPQDQAVQMVQAIMQQMQGSTPQLKRGGMMYYQDGGEDDEEEPTDWYEEGMDKDTYYGLKNQLEAEGYKSVPKSEDKVDVYSEEYKQFERDSDKLEEEEETPSYDKNSARDTWVAKTGMPWSEAKRLGYTSGSAKDNMKLLSELNDSRFDKKYLRKKPLSPAKKEAEDNRTYFGGVLKEAVITAPRKIKGASRFMFTSDKAYQDYLKDNNIKNTNNNIPTFDFSPKSQQPMFRQSYQDGGEQQIAQQVAQAIQQGMQPQEAMSMLMESGMTEDQAMQLVQVIMQQIQQQGQNPQEEMSQGTPQMRKGGEMIRRKDGSYSRRGLWDNIRDNRGSGKAPTREMLEQEAKIRGNKKEMGGYMYEYGGINNPGFRALPEYVQDKIRSNMYQEGGMEPGADPAEAMMQQISQMLQQGAEPEQIMQMLIEAGVPEDQAMQMVQAVMEQTQEPQGTPQMRDGGIPERYRKMGFTKVGAKKQSTSEGKKWMVLAKKGDQYKVVHGGDDSMKDFSQHGSEDRKDNFWNRMGGRDSAKANDPFSPLYWHKKFGTWQEGGEMMDEQMEGEDEGMENESAMLEQIESQVEEALKQGADPQQVLQQLVEMGMPEEQAMQMIQEILQEIQGGETGMEAPEESTPQMSKGGKYMRALVGKTIKNYTYNPKTDSYTVSYE
jgi:transcriptional regulator CtsR